MKPGLTAGATGELTWIVDPTVTITLGGLSDATVFSTPNMIMLMERAAREALRPYLEQHEESVGTVVNIEHVGAAKLGNVVRGVATVEEIQERQVRFDVRAYAGDREIGRGTHHRAIIQLSRFVERLNKLSDPTSNATQFLASNQNKQLASMDASASLDTLHQLKTLDVSVQDRIAMVKLDRPKSLNAVDVQMTSDLEQLVRVLSANPEAIRVVIFTGTGKAFCAGDDVIEVSALSMEEARALSHRQAKVYLSFEQLPQPTIAAVDGVAFGGGCVAAYSCDFRLATHSSRFGMPEVKLGWPPGYGIAQLTALVGKARAMEMCLLGEPISAKTAYEWGLVHEVVPGAMLMQRAQELAKRILQLPAQAIRETKRLIHLDEGSLPKVTFHADTEAYIRCLALPDAREGLAAFAEKRAAKFTGQ